MAARGLYLELVDLNEKIKSLGRKPIIINEIVRGIPTADTVEILNEVTRVHYNGDSLDVMPTCGCGALTGKFNEGQRCIEPGCPDPVVKRVLDQEYQSLVWFSNPLPGAKFINPIFWYRFNANFSSKDFDILRYMVDKRYQPLIPAGSRSEQLAQYLDDIVPERSLQYLTRDYNTFKTVMTKFYTPEMAKILSSGKPSRDQRIEQMKDFLELLELEGPKVLTKYLPYPSKWAMVTEQSGGNTFTDPTMLCAIDAAKTMASVENAIRPLTPATLNARLVNVQSMMSQFYAEFIQHTLSGKPGLFRRQLGSTRTPWSGRVVIIPLPGPHVYDEIHTPWSWTIGLLRNHIEGTLLKPPYNMNPKEISLYIDYCICNYDDQMAEILETYIKNSPLGGIPMAILRNPTLEFLSNQFLRITRVIPDPNVYAMYISNLIIKEPNADFDGDMLQCKLCLDQVEIDFYKRLTPSNGFMSRYSPNKVSNTIVLHPENISQINNWRGDCLTRALMRA
jgi:hypothetical protein